MPQYQEVYWWPIHLALRVSPQLNAILTAYAQPVLLLCQDIHGCQVSAANGVSQVDYCNQQERKLPVTWHN